MLRLAVPRGRLLGRGLGDFRKGDDDRPLILRNQLVGKDLFHHRQDLGTHRIGPGRVAIDHLLLQRHLLLDGRAQGGKLRKTRGRENLSHLAPGGEDFRRVRGRILVAGLAQDGRNGEHLAEQMVREGQRVHAPRQHHPAGIGRGIGRVLHAHLAVRVAAHVHHHAQQHRQKHHREHADDADRAALVAMQAL